MSEKNPDLDADEMMKFRCVGLIGEITDALTSDLVNRLLKLQTKSNDPITMVISSGGGSTANGLLLYDFIRFVMTAPVQAVVIGRCSSAATFALLACQRRVSMPHARFLLHSNCWSELTLKSTPEVETDIADLIAEMSKAQEEAVQLYCKELNKSRDEVREFIRVGDKRFNGRLMPEEALRIGLIHVIVSENVGLFPLIQK